MLATVYSAGLFGIDGFPVSVEVDARNNLPSFELVGLPDAAVKEAKERVRTACENTGYPFPECNLLVNLAPADRRKEGSGFDAAILTGILAAVGVIRSTVKLDDKCFVGELSLSGDFRPVRGVLSMCVAARDGGMTEFYTALENAAEASAVEGYSSASVSCWLSSRRRTHSKSFSVPPPVPCLYFQWAAIPYSAVSCISQVRIWTSKGMP